MVYVAVLRCGLHPVRSLKGIVEDCGVCSYSSNVDSELCLWFKAEGQGKSQPAKERYGFIIVASDGIKRYILKQRRICIKGPLYALHSARSINPRPLTYFSVMRRRLIGVG